MSQPEEPTILEYARFHDLVTDHLAQDPLKEVLSHEPGIGLSMEDSDDLFSISADNASVKPERLTIPIEALSYLASVVEMGSGSDIIESRIRQRRHWIRHLKVELPLLRSDPELDLQGSGGSWQMDLQNEPFPREKMDGEYDDGLFWPSMKENAVANSIASERPSFPAECLKYLQGILEYGREDTNAYHFEADSKASRRASDLFLCPMAPSDSFRKSFRTRSHLY